MSDHSTEIPSYELRVEKIRAHTARRSFHELNTVTVACKEETKTCFQPRKAT